jgi:hypothetical protein
MCPRHVYRSDRWIKEFSVVISSRFDIMANHATMLTGGQELSLNPWSGHGNGFQQQVAVRKR